MKNKKFQLAILGVLLVAVIVGGIWFLTGGFSKPDVPDNTLGTPPDSGTDIDWLNVEDVHYRVLNETEKDLMVPFGLSNITSPKFCLCQGQICQFTIDGDGEDAVLQLVSVHDGRVLKRYDQSCFSDFFWACYLDGEEQLWTIQQYIDGESAFFQLCLCEPGKEPVNEVLDMKDAAGRYPLNPEEYNPRSFALWGDFAVVLSGHRTKNLFGLHILNRTEKTAKTLSLGPDREIVDFCMDGMGNFYALASEGSAKYTLLKYSLEDGEIVWQNAELPYMTQELWYGGGKLFLLGDTPAQRIMTVDTETGALGKDVLNFWSDAGMQQILDAHSTNGWFKSSFALDSSGRVFVCRNMGSTLERNLIRTTWTLEPYVAEVAPEDVVTLTITAPYPPDSVKGAIQMYQRQHPEVQVVWDTQYISRDEFRPNILEYKDQIAVRTMTGDVGDIQMILGSGLGQDVITDTDAFTDLTPYLDACPFRDELEMNLLEPLRGEDGAVRALPLAIQPQYAIYNMTLLEKLGNPVDPDSVTWSELLDLALQWKEEGTDLSLTSCSPGAEGNAREVLLQRLLLANLYDAEQAGGTVQLDQPYLRELLVKLKELWDTPQLVRQDGNHVQDGFFQKSLFMTFTLNRSSMDRLSDGSNIPKREGIKTQAAPLPWGEVYHKQQVYGYCWGIPASSEQKDAAWDLLQFLISSEGLPGYSYTEETELLNNAAQELWYEQYQRTGMVPSREFFEQTQALRKLPISRFDEPYGWTDAVLKPILKYMSDEITLDQAMEEANNNWERFVLE